MKTLTKLRNLEFEVTIEQMWDLFEKQNKKCALSGVDLRFKDTRANLNKTASLDRKDPKIGYVLDNIQWVHVELNYMKQSLNDNEFLEWVEKIHSYNKNKKDTLN